MRRLLILAASVQAIRRHQPTPLESAARTGSGSLLRAGAGANESEGKDMSMETSCAKAIASRPRNLSGRRLVSAVRGAIGRVCSRNVSKDPGPIPALNCRRSAGHSTEAAVWLAIYA